MARDPLAQHVNDAGARQQMPAIRKRKCVHASESVGACLSKATTIIVAILFGCLGLCVAVVLVYSAAGGLQTKNQNGHSMAPEEMLPSKRLSHTTRPVSTFYGCANETSDAVFVAAAWDGPRLSDLIELGIIGKGMNEETTPWFVKEWMKAMWDIAKNFPYRSLTYVRATHGNKNEERGRHYVYFPNEDRRGAKAVDVDDLFDAYFRSPQFFGNNTVITNLI